MPLTIRSKWLLPRRHDGEDLGCDGTKLHTLKGGGTGSVLCVVSTRDPARCPSISTPTVRFRG